MLLPRPKTLREHILLILARTPRTRAPDILSALSNDGVQVTKQGMYKELRKLIEDSVAIKHGAEFSLSIPWILGFSNLADRMFDTYIEQSNLEMFIGEGKNSGQWTFRNLALLNDFWVELVFTLLKENPEGLYNWLPHPWFILLQSVRSKTWGIAMKEMGITVKTILGHDTDLDREYARRQKAFLPSETISFAASPFHGNDRQYLEIIGEWLITLTLDPGLVDIIENCFSNGGKKFEGQWFNDAAALLRAERRPCKLRLERGTPKSRKVRKLFTEYWEP